MRQNVLLCVAAFALAPGAVAQTANTYAYASDYEVASWPVEDRVRPEPRDPNTLQTNSALLGGPVPQVERHQIRNSEDNNVRVVMTDATRARVNASNAGGLPGREVENRLGTSLGRIAVAERDRAGGISTIWVQPPSRETGELRQVDVRSVTLRNGRVIVETR